jgi:hypothetical protein
MKALFNIIIFLGLGISLNAQSLHGNGKIQSSGDDQINSNETADVQEDGEWILVTAFDQSNGLSRIDKEIDGDIIEIKSFPNPAMDYLTLEIEGDLIEQQIQFSIYNVNGQEEGDWELVEAFGSGNTYRFDVSKLSSGMHILQIKNNSIHLNKTQLIEKF